MGFGILYRLKFSWCWTLHTAPYVSGCVSKMRQYPLSRQLVVSSAEDLNVYVNQMVHVRAFDGIEEIDTI